jgi:hypothetical protein
MFKFTMRFETFSIKSPTKWLSFPKKAKVKCKIAFVINLEKILQFR